MRKKILVVDDNTELLHLLRLSFKAEGFSIATATNGIEALRKARALLPNLVLLDLVLPELDGFAVCETLRRGRETASIPILILTGLSSEFARFAGMEAGATAYLVKPQSPKSIVAKVKELLAQAPTPPPARKQTKSAGHGCAGECRRHAILVERATSGAVA